MTELESGIKEQIDALLAKTGVSEKEFMDQFWARYAVYAKNMKEGQEQYPIQFIAFKSVKGRYQSATKSNAVFYTGYFFGVDKINDFTKKIYADAMQIVEDYKTTGGENWIAEGMKYGICNENGEPVYDESNIMGKTWLIGKTIPPSEPTRRLFAILTDMEGKKNVAVIYTSDVKNFIPVPGRIYKFRAGKHKDTPVWQINTTSVTKLEYLGASVTYEEVITDFSKFVKPIVRNFDEVFDVNNQQVNPPVGAPKQLEKIAITGVSVCDISVLPVNKSEIDYVDMIETFGNYEDNITMVAQKDTPMDIADDSVGIAIYSPYFSKDKDRPGMKKPGANLIGFIVNEEVTPLPSVKPNMGQKASTEDDYE